MYQVWKKSNRSRAGGPRGGSGNRPKSLPSSIASQVGTILDEPYLKVDRAKPIRERGKLSQPLIKLPSAIEDDEAVESFLKGDAIEIEDIMNEALAKPSFAKLFPDVSDVSNMIEFQNVRLNRDCSHADVLWTSSPLQQFYDLLLTKSLEQSKHGKVLSYNLSDVQRFESKIERVNQELQNLEGKFRSEVIRRINFRRVPRIFIHPDPELLNVLSRLRELVISLPTPA